MSYVRPHTEVHQRLAIINVVVLSFVLSVHRTTAGPAEANFHWTGNSLIFIFIALARVDERLCLRNESRQSAHFLSFYCVACANGSIIALHT